MFLGEYQRKSNAKAVICTMKTKILDKSLRKRLLFGDFCYILIGVVLYCN